MAGTAAAAGTDGERGQLMPLWSEAAPAGAPEWFVRAVDAPRQRGLVRVDASTQLEYLRWESPRPDARGLVFVHGASANAHWYSFIAPFFSEEFDVVALTSSGCGSSDFRDKYTGEVFGDEIVAATEKLGLFDRPDKPFLVTHSFGSIAGMSVALRHGERFGGIILTDVRLQDLPSHELRKHLALAMKQRRESKQHQSRTAWQRYAASLPPVEKFKLAPEQPCNNQFVLEYVANTSAVRESDSSWHWVGDPDRFRKLSVDEGSPDMSCDELERALHKVPVALIYGAESWFLTLREIRETVHGRVRELCPMIKIPNAHHHIMLDQPLAFVTAVSALLSQMPHTTHPHAPPASKL